MSQSVEKEYRIQRLSTEAELVALQGAWKNLTDSVKNIPIFLTWEWISIWWHHYGQLGELWLLVVRDATGDLAGLIPLMLTRRRVGVLWVRCLLFAGASGVASDHLDILARPGELSAVVAALWAYLDAHRGEWDLLELKGLAQDSPLRPFLTKAKGRYRERDAVICPFVRLPADWATLQSEGMSSRRRKKLRYYRRLLERHHPGEVTLHRVVDATRLSQAMDTLVVLHRKRWHERGIMTAFDDSRFVGFHREMASLALEQGWLRLHQLRVGDEAIATLYGFQYRDTFYHYQGGFDPDWGDYSPGYLLLVHAMENAIGDGAREFDFLRGPEDYKLDWADSARTDLHVLLSTGWRGDLWLLLATLHDTSKTIGRAVLPQRVKLSIEQVISRIGTKREP